MFINYLLAVLLISPVPFYGLPVNIWSVFHPYCGVLIFICSLSHCYGLNTP